MGLWAWCARPTPNPRRQAAEDAAFRGAVSQASRWRSSRRSSRTSRPPRCRQTRWANAAAGSSRAEAAAFASALGGGLRLHNRPADGTRRPSLTRASCLCAARRSLRPSRRRPAPRSCRPSRSRCFWARLRRPEGTSEWPARTQAPRACGRSPLAGGTPLLPASRRRTSKAGSCGCAAAAAQGTRRNQPATWLGAGAALLATAMRRHQHLHRRAARRRPLALMTPM
jgi:hypothetical protein